MKKLMFCIYIIIINATFAQERISYATKEFGRLYFDVSQEFIYANTQKKTSNAFSEEEGFKLIRVDSHDYERRMIETQKIYKHVEPVLLFNNTYQVSTNEIIVKFKDNYDPHKFFKQFNIELSTPSKFVDNQYLIRFKDFDTYKTFELVNLFYKDKRIDFIEPNFIILNALHNDPFLSSQWALDNQGYLGGTVDADMDIVEAWQYSTGEGIKIAILDNGVQLDHPDLQANLLPGYDAINHSTQGGNISNSDTHGTECAGIIASVANDIGGRGVAYNSKIIPVRIMNNNYSTFNYMLEGFYWAVNNGADILSNSWEAVSPSQALNNAIHYAVTNGRGGKGCVVLFSTGNDNKNTVAYPASLPQVIAVGASSMCDERKSPHSCDNTNWGSNYGNTLDVIAPGVKIFTTTVNSNYTHEFRGTSAACPNAAGVVALIMSLRPELKTYEIREILSKSTDKIGGYNYYATKQYGSWNNEVGYGRVNGLKAVKETLLYDVKMDVDKVLCHGNSTISLLNMSENFPFSIQWSASPNIQINGSTNSNSINVSTLTQNNEQGWIKVVIDGYYEIHKDIWIGKPTLANFNCFYQPEHPLCNTLCLNYSYTTENILTLDVQGQTDWEVIKQGNIEYNIVGNTLFIQPNQVGVSSLNIKAKNVCGLSDPITLMFKVQNCSTTNTSDNGNIYSVYPNPASEVIYITQENNIQEFVEPITPTVGKLYDMMGVLRATITLNSSTTEFVISGQPQGMYLLRIEHNEGVETHIIAIE